VLGLPPLESLHDGAELVEILHDVIEQVLSFREDTL
jgi:hypothetical protein